MTRRQELTPLRCTSSSFGTPRINREAKRHFDDLVEVVNRARAKHGKRVLSRRELISRIILNAKATDLYVHA